MWAERSRTRRIAAASIAALAVMGVGAGCGAVEHGGAGGAADGGPEPTFVPVTTAPESSVAATAPAPTAGDVPGGVAEPAPEPPPGRGGGGGGESTGGGSGTTLPAVSDRDRALVAFCSGVFDFQKAGLKLLTTASIDPNSVGAAAVDFRRKFEVASTAAPQDISAELGPMLGALQQAVPLQDVRLPAVIIAELNRALGAADAALGQAFDTMSRVCPRQVPADTVDQYRSFQLGAPVPEEFVAAVFGIKPI